jgi:hypothetical protein
LRRLSAEQVWDSLMTLTVSDIDTHKGGDASHLHELYEKHKDQTPLELYTLAVSMADKRQDLNKLGEEFAELRKKISQTPQGAEKAALVEKLKALAERREELRGQADPLQKKMVLGEGKGNGARDGKSGIGNLLRASELKSPAPNGHFLRTFGQSDRELIDNSNDSPAVTQALSLMNGLIEPEVLSSRSVLSSNLNKHSGAEQKVRVLWQTILTREPTSKELSMATRLVAASTSKEMRVGTTGFAAPADGVKDIAWALINSNEFMFIR